MPPKRPIIPSVAGYNAPAASYKAAAAGPSGQRAAKRPALSDVNGRPASTPKAGTAPTPPAPKKRTPWSKAETDALIVAWDVAAESGNAAAAIFAAHVLPEHRSVENIKDKIVGLKKMAAKLEGEPFPDGLKDKISEHLLRRVPAIVAKFDAGVAARKAAGDPRVTNMPKTGDSKPDQVVAIMNEVFKPKLKRYRATNKIVFTSLPTKAEVLHALTTTPTTFKDSWVAAGPAAAGERLKSAISHEAEAARAERKAPRVLYTHDAFIPGGRLVLSEWLP